MLETPTQEFAGARVAIRKDYRIADEGLSVTVRYRIRNVGDKPFAGTFRSTLNLGLLTESNDEDHVQVGARKFPLAKPLDVKSAEQVVIHSATRHYDLTINSETGATVTARPLYTVANSEQGFERIYQCTELTFVWEVALEPDEHEDLVLATNVVAQIVEPEVPRPGGRRRRPAQPPAAARPLAR